MSSGRIQGSTKLLISDPAHACLSCRLADLDKVLSLLSNWLGTDEATWPAVQAAAREKQPDRMRK